MSESYKRRAHAHAAVMQRIAANGEIRRFSHRDSHGLLYEQLSHLQATTAGGITCEACGVLEHDAIDDTMV